MLGGVKKDGPVFNVKALDVCQWWVIPDDPRSLREDVVMDVLELLLNNPISIASGNSETQSEGGGVGGQEAY